MSSKTLWVITCEYNDYDQYGEYFEAVFADKPTLLELTGILEDSELAEHLLNTGGGRRDWEDEWYWLREVQSGVRH